MVLLEYLKESGFLKNEEEQGEYSQFLKSLEANNQELLDMDVTYFHGYSDHVITIISFLSKFYSSYGEEDKNFKQIIFKVFLSLLRLEGYGKGKNLGDILLEVNGKFFNDKTRPGIEDNSFAKNLYFCTEEDIESLKQYFLKAKNLKS